MPALSRRSVRPGVAAATLAALAAVAFASPAAAYIGPGAGFALVTSFAVVFVALVVAILAVLTWPFRMLWRAFRRPKTGKARVRRVIVVGLDGQDPRLTDRFMAEGKLPHFKKLADGGCYHRLKTTYPSISPVAWSSFSTGTHPAKHNIYDFLDRDRKTYLPLLSSTEISSVKRRGAKLLSKLPLGKYRIPEEKPQIRLLRKSKPFWTVLGEHFIWSTVLRVPITFPPDRFYGAQLSAMCVPDLLGTQGTFLLLTTRPAAGAFKEGGMRVPLTNGKAPGRWDALIEGPENAYLEGSPPMTLPFTVTTNGGTTAHVAVGEEELDIESGKLSPWVTLEFKAAPGVKVKAIVRLQLLEAGEHVSIYMTPLNLDPESPAMPISHPSYYATYLAKKVGAYATLGLAEDTWALNEDVTDDGTFLEQTYDIDREREEMFFAAMDRLKKGSLVTVFDATDRIQHMFWRYIEEGHPAAVGKENAEHRDAIEKLYLHNDALVGRVMKKLRKGDLLFVISDHGFTSFRRGVNLNAWLHANGYLHLKDGCDGSTEWLRDVDWSRTKAYCLGLTGMFLNVEGREAQGIVKPGREAQQLKDELVAKITGLRDEEKNEVGITEAFDTAKLYGGPYLGNAPDLILGFNSGYRTSWDCATGMVSGPVFEDNTKAWSGDHGVDPRQVPGVLFANAPIDDDDPALMDLAPTILELFGIKAPDHMEGKALFGTETRLDERLTGRVA
ncbi:MAG: alkaline phosphatase family protein [Thermoanaerobaculia bacterium]